MVLFNNLIFLNKIPKLKKANFNLGFYILILVDNKNIFLKILIFFN
jgi:hypothetical protein